VWARVLQNRSVFVPGDGRTRIQFLHVEDLVSTFLRVIEKAPDTVAVFNVAGVDRPTLAEWVAATAQAAGFPDPTVLAGTQPLEVRKDFPFFDAPLCVETSLIESVLGWRPRYSLAAGLKQTYAFLEMKK
jgi:nucleoside-diphosphate-sugar epimerase